MHNSKNAPPLARCPFLIQHIRSADHWVTICLDETSISVRYHKSDVKYHAADTARRNGFTFQNRLL